LLRSPLPASFFTNKALAETRCGLRRTGDPESRADPSSVGRESGHLQTNAHRYLAVTLLLSRARLPSLPPPRRAGLIHHRVDDASDPAVRWHTQRFARRAVARDAAPTAPQSDQPMPWPTGSQHRVDDPRRRPRLIVFRLAHLSFACHNRCVVCVGAAPLCLFARVAGVAVWRPARRQRLAGALAVARAVHKISSCRPSASPPAGVGTGSAEGGAKGDRITEWFCHPVSR
jgi:hypothetical protein